MTEPNHIAEASKKVSRPQIREVFLRNGFTIKPDRDDLHDYVYEAAFELLELAAPAVQGDPVAHTFYVLHDSTEGQKYIKKDIDDGCLIIFEREEDAQRGKRRHPGTDYKRVDYYTAPQAEQQPRSDALIVEQTERVAAILAKELFGSELPPGANFRDSGYPKAQTCWRIAADIQEELTDTDVENALAELEDEQQPFEWPKLDAPAKVGAGRFDVGVSSRLVVEAAQRQYEYDITPEKEADRIALLDAFRQALHPAPDVSGLVDALERCITSMLDSGYRADAVVIRAARYALAAHRKQGGEVCHRGK